MTDKDFLSEFDEPSVTSSEELKTEIEFDPASLPAAIADPLLQEAIVHNPKTGLVERAPDNGGGHLRWHRIPMPIRERAFFLWLECGTFVETASVLGMKPEAIKRLSVHDKWEDRAERLRHGLEKGFLVSVVSVRQQATNLIASTLESLSPDKIASMLDGKDVVRLLTSLVKDGTPAAGGLTVQTGGAPAQVNLGGTQPGQAGRYSSLSDEDLAAMARSRGVEVQASPIAVDRPPLSLPEPDSGGTEVSVSESELDSDPL